MHHVDPFEVDESFADLQAEQHQGYIGQLVLVLSQVVAQLQECQHTVRTGIRLQSLYLNFCHVELGCKTPFFYLNLLRLKNKSKVYQILH